jgi:aspartate/methionine/tyrosine aminotransferase
VLQVAHEDGLQRALSALRESREVLGDGLTDIPCFSLLKKEHGASFGVFDPARKESARKAFTEFLQTDRVISMHAPRYGPGDELGSLLRTAVATRASAITIQRAQAESSL